MDSVFTHNYDTVRAFTPPVFETYSVHALEILYDAGYIVDVYIESGKFPSKSSLNKTVIKQN